ncbi:hypothetical protein BRN26_01020 [Xanthomonas oryzae pv. oryzae]|nr:hypothetical protein BRN26_01020 [Xanthomonas oryzae pv. oryzae]
MRGRAKPRALVCLSVFEWLRAGPHCALIQYRVMAVPSPQPPRPQRGRSKARAPVARNPCLVAP